MSRGRLKDYRKGREYAYALVESRLGLSWPEVLVIRFRLLFNMGAVQLR